MVVFWQREDFKNVEPGDNVYLTDAALFSTSFRSSFTFTNDLRWLVRANDRFTTLTTALGPLEAVGFIMDGDDYTVSRRVQFIMQHFRFTGEIIPAVDAAPVLAIEAPDNGIQNEPVGATEWSVVYGPGTDLLADPDGDGIPQSPRFRPAGNPFQRKPRACPCWTRPTTTAICTCASPSKRIPTPPALTREAD
jgi:hypothetical protein